jgi:hypothetical protein
MKLQFQERSDLELVSLIIPPPDQLLLKEVPESNGFFEKDGKIHKHNKKIQPKILEKEVAEAIKSFRGKLKWSDNPD